MLKKILLPLAAAFLVFVPSAFAAPQEAQDCQSLSWSANTEEDLAGYRIYVSPDGVNYGPPVEVPKAETSIACAAIGLTPTTTGHKDYHLHMTAYDTSGNESAPSEAKHLRMMDVTAPSPPQNFCAEITWNDQKKIVCLTITDP